MVKGRAHRHGSTNHLGRAVGRRRDVMQAAAKAARTEMMDRIRTARQASGAAGAGGSGSGSGAQRRRQWRSNAANARPGCAQGNDPHRPPYRRRRERQASF